MSTTIISDAKWHSSRRWSRSALLLVTCVNLRGKEMADLHTHWVPPSRPLDTNTTTLLFIVHEKKRASSPGVDSFPPQSLFFFFPGNSDHHVTERVTVCVWVSSWVTSKQWWFSVNIKWPNFAAAAATTAAAQVSNIPCGSAFSDST